MMNACATCCAGTCRVWQMTFSKAACGTNWTGWMRAVPRGDGHGGCPGGLAAAVLLVCHRLAWEGVLALSRWVVEAADRLGSLGSLDVRWVLAGGLAVVCGVLAYPLAKRWL